MKAANFNNYEELIIDYVDGKLSAEETADLLLFIEQNQSIKNTFELLTSPISVIGKDESMYFKKEDLKKPFLANDETIIDYLENNLNIDDKATFFSVLEKSNSLKKDLNAYKKTFFTPDTSIVYPFKKKLKRETRIVMLFTYSAAASLIFFLIYTNSSLRNTSLKLENNLVQSSPSSISSHSKIKNTTDAKNMIVPLNSQIKSNNNFISLTRNKKPYKTTITPQIHNHDVLINENDLQTEIKENTAVEVEPSNFISEEPIKTVFAENNIYEMNTSIINDSPLTFFELVKKKANEFLSKKTGYSVRKEQHGTLTAYQFSTGDFEFYKTFDSK